ncbi:MULTISPECIES: hypothetical protein [Lactobacillus]|uniref:Tetratricopeptide repeat protein n=1 Tax=Lactobacillus xujianguonis TaxID=2495899 RepID=A0A437SV06_9LACO|nr:MULTISPECIES: hypothetical protein [Lactobacillus]RVU70647.1 tetratricopeptide repeat protein [Lactobacillus xujianguonis]RVU73248.1 tetratricopeptide repeat protein [Lactobacillus xujianguonis]
MVSLSQENLMKLAEENEKNHNLTGAIQNLLEALRMHHDTQIVLRLCDLYCRNKQEDQAYTLIKEEPDLFSDQQVYLEYFNVLAANHFLIEALQVEHVSGRKAPLQVTPASDQDQKMIMDLFKRQKNISQFDYEQLLKLNLINFKSFAQSLLLDPSQNFAVRLAICEDLVRLGVTEEVKVWVIGKMQAFIPAETVLLEKNTIYQEVIASLGSKFRNNPSQLPLMLGEANLIFGSLYPMISSYIKDPDSFTSDLVSFLETKNGRSHQELLEKIYQNLPQ